MPFNIYDINDWTTLFDKNNPIKTPNLERLAARGTLFSRAYCVVPACGPSRAALLMGYRPDTTQSFDNHAENGWFKTLPDAVTLPDYFRQHGYVAKGAGKVFYHTGEFAQYLPDAARIGRVATEGRQRGGKSCSAAQGSQR